MNTGVPVLVLAALAVLLPWLLSPRGTLMQREVAVAVWAAAGCLLIAGAVVFAAIYGLRGVAVWSAFVQAPVATGRFFLRLSGFAALFWVPLMALAWLTLAQGVERRKGEAMARGDREGEE